MQEGSGWRYGLAQQIASHYDAHPKVAAVLVEGSVARGDADGFSDLDLAVFWAEPPTAQVRRDSVKRAGGRRWHRVPFQRAEGCWSDTYEVGGVAVDVLHTTVAATERLLAAVLEHADPGLAKQQRLAALHSAFPLANPALITRWQQQAAAYPHELAVAIVQTHLRFPPPGSKNSWPSATRCWCSTTPSVLPRSSSCSSCWGSTTSTIPAGRGWIG